ncbi:PREDICTED: uncharacterized protein LOC107098183 [Cyprinodon variegatus]|uniref:uncharacterized protein LOC107098183 n=1 Tax=Cyprinodon variegatus TaxID=28743 RepID=UPI000742B1A9|nr:PREDICTED: uncharacterized protein LOC107098183 [Cyprinodon variegatus]
MKAKWWSCVLGLLCMPAEVILKSYTASQSPSSISYVRVNSSMEIECSSNLEKPTGLSFKRHFLGDEQILYLFYGDGAGKLTKKATFKERIDVIQNQPKTGDHRKVRIKLFQMGRNDTDLYYCSWTYMNETNYVELSLESNGTVIIVSEHGPEIKGSDHALEMTLIYSSIAAFTFILIVIIGIMTVRCRRFKKDFTPDRPYAPPLPPRPSRAPRPIQPGNIYPQEPNPYHCPYMMTSTNDYGIW